MRENSYQQFKEENMGYQLPAASKKTNEINENNETNQINEINEINEMNEINENVGGIS